MPSLQAPFYLFDEIDAALDAQYRTAVARWGGGFPMLVTWGWVKTLVPSEPQVIAGIYGCE